MTYSGRPLRMRLMSQLIKVEWVENLFHEAPDHAGDVQAHKAMGVYESSQQVISMDRELGFERERQTFLHENLHAIVAMSGLEVAFNDGAEEHIVAVLAPILLSWLRDNPHAVKWLMEVQ